MTARTLALAGILLGLAMPAGAQAPQAPQASTPAAQPAQPAQAAKPDSKPADGAAATATPDKPAAAARRPLESLMFTTDEFNDIRSRVGSGEETENSASMGRQAIEDATLYLSTILYYGPKEWTIWVNGVPIGPDQEFKSFQVTDIGADSVQLLVPLSAQGMRPVKLSPNQTFITKTGTVVEGRAQ